MKRKRKRKRQTKTAHPKWSALYGCLRRELSAEAIAAIHRSVAARLERNLAGASAISADCVKHHALFAATGALLARGAAIFAALRFVGEPFFREELLLAGGEGEVLPAIFADDDFVAKHVIPSFLSFLVVRIPPAWGSGVDCRQPPADSRGCLYPAI